VQNSRIKRENSVVKILQLIGGPWRRGPSHGITGTMVNPALRAGWEPVIWQDKVEVGVGYIAPEEYC